MKTELNEIIKNKDELNEMNLSEIISYLDELKFISENSSVTLFESEYNNENIIDNRISEILDEKLSSEKYIDENSINLFKLYLKMNLEISDLFIFDELESDLEDEIIIEFLIDKYLSNKLNEIDSFIEISDCISIYDEYSIYDYIDELLIDCYLIGSYNDNRNNIILNYFNYDKFISDMLINYELTEIRGYYIIDYYS